MSRSRKDGRQGGSHRQKRNQGYEYWSARCPHRDAQGFGAYAKRHTHRYERRQAIAAVREQVAEPAR
jgi:hypothetical protein